MGNICIHSVSDIQEHLSIGGNVDEQGAEQSDNKSVNKDERSVSPTDSPETRLFSHSIHTTGMMPSSLDKNNKFVEKKDGIEIDLSVLYPLSDIRASIQCPQQYSVNQWIYIQTKEFIEEIKLIYESISSVCTLTSCPEMTAGPHFTYLWTDKNLKTSIRTSACDYINMLFTWIGENMDTKEYMNCVNDNVFPQDYMDLMKIIYKRLFRVLAHIYHHHLDRFKIEHAEKHLNTTFIRFDLFGKEYNLLSTKEEYPLKKLIREILAIGSQEADVSLDRNKTMKSVSLDADD
ncbi:hypothetical protein WA158_005245 [Blastocystis sp. Blastoise]